MRGLVRVSTRRQASDGALARRLATLAEPDWEGVVLELVSAEVASVLGHAPGQAVDPQRAFKELGFDSLSAVELRNRLSAAAGLRLPSTLVFDHPSPAAVAKLLVRDLSRKAGPGGNGSSEDAEVRSLIASIPLTRLRQSGLLDQLLELRSGEAVTTSSEGGAPVALDDLDAEDLIRMTIENGDPIRNPEAGGT
jgi:polyketide synthase 12